MTTKHVKQLKMKNKEIKISRAIMCSLKIKYLLLLLDFGIANTNLLP